MSHFQHPAGCRLRNIAEAKAVQSLMRGSDECLARKRHLQELRMEQGVLTPRKTFQKMFFSRSSWLLSCAAGYSAQRSYTSERDGGGRRTV